MTEQKRAEVQYLATMGKILKYGHDIKNQRTGKFCRTIINADLVYNVSKKTIPILTTRELNYKIAIAELLGYIRGYTSADQFRQLGTKSWDANANDNTAWLSNPNRKGKDDMGMVYGAVARNWPNPSNEQMDLFKKVYHNLKHGIDDRGEIITFWNPGLFSYGCLRPCLHTYQFSLLNGYLYLNAFQRSADWPLGVASNMIQVYLFLALMAQITNKKPFMAYHKLINCHIYEDQIEGAEEQIKRSVLDEPTIDINPDIKTLEDLETWVSLNDFHIHYTHHHPPIKYPFSA